MPEICSRRPGAGRDPIATQIGPRPPPGRQILQRRLLDLGVGLARALQVALRLFHFRGVAGRFDLLELRFAPVNPVLGLLQRNLALLLEAVVAAMSDFDALALASAYRLPCSPVRGPPGF